MTLDKYQHQMLRTWWSTDDPRFFDLEHPILGLAVEAGELLKIYHKAKFKPSHEMDRILLIDRLTDELVDCYYFLVALAWLFDLTMDDLMRLSWEKLSGGKHGWPENDMK